MAFLSELVAGCVVFVLTMRFFKSLDVEKKEYEETMVIKPSKPGVILTIAREHGSCGKEIGRIVSEKLGIPFYYKEMTALAAQESGLAKEFVSDLNENSSKLFHRLYLSSDVIQQAIIAQEQIIRKIADEGSCVIVGRAADYVLKDYDQIISIFMYAPKEVRIKNVMKMYQDTYEVAKEHIQHSDEARASYYENISKKSWKNVDNYDLCIDTSIGLYQAATSIVNYVENLKRNQYEFLEKEKVRLI